ncbi:MAG: hypothetical protein JO110_25350 [Acetobacteraceae bacterium]|nr:hypothetical protein [Acetobacteraceae bacterium]
MRSRKLSGVELARQLEGLTNPAGGATTQAEPDKLEPTQEGEVQPPSPAEAIFSSQEAEVRASTTQGPKPRTSGQGKARGGRPAKAGTDGMPVNVRLSQADHLALARLAGKLVVPGRPMPTVQDVVRGIIRGALKEPELATRFCRQQDS